MPDCQLILDSLRQLVRALRLSSAKAEASHGLSSAQLFVLQKIRPAEEISVNEIAARTQTHQSSVSAVIAKLEAKKLLKRSTSKSDRRKSFLSLTAEGTKLSRKKTDLIQDRLIQAIQQLPARDRTKLAGTLHQIVTAAIPREQESAPPLFFEEGKK